MVVPNRIQRICSVVNFSVSFFFRLSFSFSGCFFFLFFSSVSGFPWGPVHNLLRALFIPGAFLANSVGFEFPTYFGLKDGGPQELRSRVQLWNKPADPCARAVLDLSTVCQICNCSPPRRNLKLRVRGSRTIPPLTHDS